ncbi:hypothetical protein SBRY_50245 [Actinacidiphila bryophytorum]|uniref:Uncharacterized protein n=1 Tax=Actinacidiphila bryophytorum TaxID=1436133 RepID=A0A9W4MEG5_9ACTN|nr:hypothetical protein SBRY_50245 [Actinacidiphila bryophytorum]
MGRVGGRGRREPDHHRGPHAPGRCRSRQNRRGRRRAPAHRVHRRGRGRQLPRVPGPDALQRQTPRPVHHVGRHADHHHRRLAVPQGGDQAAGGGHRLRHQAGQAVERDRHRLAYRHHRERLGPGQERELLGVRRPAQRHRTLPGGHRPRRPRRRHRHDQGVRRRDHQLRPDDGRQGGHAPQQQAGRLLQHLRLLQQHRPADGVVLGREPDHRRHPVRRRQRHQEGRCRCHRLLAVRQGRVRRGRLRPAHRPDDADRVRLRRHRRLPQHPHRERQPAAQQRVLRTAVAGRRVRVVHGQPGGPAGGHPRDRRHGRAARHVRHGEPARGLAGREVRQRGRTRRRRGLQGTRRGQQHLLLVGRRGRHALRGQARVEGAAPGEHPEVPARHRQRARRLPGGPLEGRRPGLLAHLDDPDPHRRRHVVGYEHRYVDGHEYGHQHGYVDGHEHRHIHRYVHGHLDRYVHRNHRRRYGRLHRHLHPRQQLDRRLPGRSRRPRQRNDRAEQLEGRHDAGLGPDRHQPVERRQLRYQRRRHGLQRALQRHRRTRCLDHLRLHRRRQRHPAHGADLHRQLSSG